MPRFNDEEIQRLIKDVESRPELLDLTLTKLIKKCPYLVEAYNLRKEDDPKSKAAFQAFWSRLRKKIAGKLDQENNAGTQRPDPPRASLPVDAMPSMPGNQTRASRTLRHSSAPTVHNPAPMQQQVQPSIVYIVINGDQMNGNTENHPPDADSLAKDIAERVTETLSSALQSSLYSEFANGRLRAPPIPPQTSYSSL